MCNRMFKQLCATYNNTIVGFIRKYYTDVDMRTDRSERFLSHFETQILRVTVLILSEQRNTDVQKFTDNKIDVYLHKLETDCIAPSHPPRLLLHCARTSIFVLPTALSPVRDEAARCAGPPQGSTLDSKLSADVTRNPKQGCQ